MADDAFHVLVVARVGVQLRRAGKYVADMPALALPYRQRHQAQAEHAAQRGIARLRDAAETLHGGVPLLAQALDADDVARIEAAVAGQHRQHHQVGDDLVQDADRCGDGQFANHRNGHQHQGREADEGRDQRQASGNQQADEAASRGGHGVGAGADFLGNEVDLLHPVGNADGEDQERHQDRQRIEAEPQQGDGAELPDHRHQRTHQRQEGQHPGAGVPVHGEQGQEERQGEETDDALRAGADVAHLLGEADDLHVEVGIAVARTQLRLEALAEFQIVQALACRRIGVGQFGHHHGSGVVVGDQAADESADDGALADTGDCRGIEIADGDIAADYVLGLHPLFCDLHRPGVRRPQGGHAAAVDAGHEEQGLGHVIETGHRLRGPDVPMAGAQHHDDAVGAEQYVAVLVEGLDEGVFLGQLLVETGRHFQARGEQRHYQGDAGQRGEGRQPVAEQYALEPEHQRREHESAFLNNADRPLARRGPGFRTSRRCCR
ncbi:hypothetical protein D9M69_310550 [compost metagenome]